MKKQILTLSETQIDNILDAMWLAVAEVDYEIDKKLAEKLLDLSPKYKHQGLAEHLGYDPEEAEWLFGHFKTV